MAETTRIEWADKTYNPWRGCTKVSEGCRFCYGEKDRSVRMHGIEWGPGKPRRRKAASTRDEPKRWDRKAAKTCRCGHGFDMHGYPGAECKALASEDRGGQRFVETGAIDGDSWCHCAGFNASRPRVFCGSLCDWLDPELPAEWLADLLALIAETPHLCWLLLTKRPELWRERLRAVIDSGHHGADMIASQWALEGGPPANVWMGVTVENQEMTKRIPELLRIPARVRFLSVEPMLSRIDLNEAHEEWWESANQPIWVIVGAESGPNARPMDIEWARSLRDQCVSAGVPFFLKQMQVNGKLVKMPKLDGKIWDQVPEVA